MWGKLASHRRGETERGGGILVKYRGGKGEVIEREI